MTRTLALELAPDQVRVNCVCPGYIDTPAIQLRNTVENGRIDRYVGGATPLSRLGTARECASSIFYLASADAAYCTGITLVSDGGCLAQASFGTKELI
jgi:NAD(P)-dependent dehydrogenase (short-subunit alcohol dehydrogenase family)